MVFAARTGPLGSTVHFWEYSASQDGCICAGHTYWSQERLQRAVLVGGQTPSEKKGMLRAAQEPKMTSISAMPPDRSGTGRARGAEYSVFCTARAGVHQDQEEHPSFLCNL